MKRIDADVLALRRCVKALDKSSSDKMILANLRYLLDRYTSLVAKREAGK